MISQRFKLVTASSQYVWNTVCMNDMPVRVTWTTHCTIFSRSICRIYVIRVSLRDLPTSDCQVLKVTVFTTKLQSFFYKYNYESMFISSSLHMVALMLLCRRMNSSNKTCKYVSCSIYNYCSYYLRFVWFVANSLLHVVHKRNREQVMNFLYV